MIVTKQDMIDRTVLIVRHWLEKELPEEGFQSEMIDKCEKIISENLNFWKVS